MYGVVIEKGPQNWQILQQKNGKAVAELSGRVEVEDEVLSFDDKLMFSVTDSKGRITPIDYSCPGDNSIELIFDREIEAQAVVNCDGYNDSGLIPYDLYTRLPILPFNGIKVKNS